MSHRSRTLQSATRPRQRPKNLASFQLPPWARRTVASSLLNRSLRNPQPILIIPGPIFWVSPLRVSLSLIYTRFHHAAAPICSQQRAPRKWLIGPPEDRSHCRIAIISDHSPLDLSRLKLGQPHRNFAV